MTENEAKWEYCRAIDLIKRIKTEETHERYIDRHKAFDLAIQALEKVQQFEAIGTIEEFKALKEKSMANETVENDAYLWSCKCPNCGKKIHRGSEERTFYCEQCGIQLHQRAFTEKELDEARFERQMDEYED